jgi:hypothetical protein
MRNKIDLFFTLNYEYLTKVASDLIRQNNRNYDPETIVNNAFMYLVKKQDELGCDTNIQIWALQYMRVEVQMSGSSMNAKRVKNPMHHRINLDVSDYWKGDETDEGTDYKFRELLNHYLKYNPSKIKTKILNAYVNKGVSTIRTLSDYFNVSDTFIHLRLKEIRADLKELSKRLY